MLETEIKKLSAQIEQLNNNFAQFFSAQVSEESQTPRKIPDNENQLEQNEIPTITKDALRDLCLLKSREDKNNKSLIKGILKDLDAKLVDDLTPDNLIEAHKLIGAL